MNKIKLQVGMAWVIWTLICGIVQGKEYDPIALYLTWQRSPETTMMVNWISNADKADDLVEYQRVGETTWKSVVGDHVKMPERYPFLIHHVELNELLPNTDYFFKIGEEGVKYKFRTMPHKIRGALRFAVGGDIYHDGIDLVNKMNKEVAKLDPMFVVCGGDLAYNEGKSSLMPRMMPRWMDWLISWKKTMVTTDGRLIPMVPVVGNHDIGNKYTRSAPQGSYYRALFSIPGRTYNVLDFGAYMSIVLLDTGHLTPIAGEQTRWLQNVLSTRTDVPHQFAVYHVPGFPSVRSYEGADSKEIRVNWVPLFEKYGTKVAFEHHDHAYKRTHPILGGKVDPKGVVYIGDGGWGVKNPRTPKKPASTWYLAKTAASRNAILVTIHDRKRYFTAIDEEGRMVDEYLHKPYDPAEKE